MLKSSIVETDEAPNIRGRYPLAGVRLGPAWRAAWRALGTGEWVEMRAMSIELGREHGLTPQAVAAVLTQATVARLLERRVRTDGRLIELRRADVPERPAEARTAPARPHIAPPRGRRVTP